MPAPISAERWAAARALMRLEAPTQARIAAAMGIHQSTLAKRIATEDWPILDFRRQDLATTYEALRGKMMKRFVLGMADLPQPEEAIEVPEEIEAAPPPTPPDADEAPRDRAERVAALLLRNSDLLIARAETQGGVLTKQQVDTVSAMLRLAERLETQAERSAAEKQIRSDAEIADILKRVDDRIVELAYAYAKRIVARWVADLRSGAGDPGGLAARLGGGEADG